MGLIALTHLFLYPAFIQEFNLYTKYSLLERSCDEEYIKHHKSTF